MAWRQRTGCTSSRCKKEREKFVPSSKKFDVTTVLRGAAAVPASGAPFVKETLRGEGHRRLASFEIPNAAAKTETEKGEAGGLETVRRAGATWKIAEPTRYLGGSER